MVGFIDFIKFMVISAIIFFLSLHLLCGLQIIHVWFPDIVLSLTITAAFLCISLESVFKFINCFLLCRIICSLSSLGIFSRYCMFYHFNFYFEFLIFYFFLLMFILSSTILNCYNSCLNALSTNFISNVIPTFVPFDRFFSSL